MALVFASGLAARSLTPGNQGTAGLEGVSDAAPRDVNATEIRRGGGVPFSFKRAVTAHFIARPGPSKLPRMPSPVVSIRRPGSPTRRFTSLSCSLKSRGRERCGVWDGWATRRRVRRLAGFPMAFAKAAAASPEAAASASTVEAPAPPQICRVDSSGCRGQSYLTALMCLFDRHRSLENNFNQDVYIVTLMLGGSGRIELITANPYGDLVHPNRSLVLHAPRDVGPPIGLGI